VAAAYTGAPVGFPLFPLVRNLDIASAEIVQLGFGELTGNKTSPPPHLRIVELSYFIHFFLTFSF
jgi:hypothetical protein